MGDFLSGGMSCTGNKLTRMRCRSLF